MKHISDYDLALYAGEEMSRWEQLRVSFHLRTCTECKAHLEEFSEMRVSVKNLGMALPANLDWDRLASEMRANIHLGLEAGECVAGPVIPALRPAQLTGWRPAAVLAGAVLVVAVAWWSNSQTAHIPTNMTATYQKDSRPELKAGVEEGVRLETTSSAIKVNDNGRVLSLMHPKDSNVVVSVSLQGSVRARYVDSESGQVTINNAYVQ